MTRPSNAALISRACSTPEARAARSANAKASWSDPAVRARRIAALKAAAAKPDVKRRRRVAIVLAMRDPDTRRELQINCSNSPQFAKQRKDLRDALGAALGFHRAMRANDGARRADKMFAFAAYRASLAAAAIEGGVAPERGLDLHAWCGRKTSKLGGLAQYLAVTAFGVPHHLLAESCGLDRRFMRRACARIEDGRDDEGTDALLTRIEGRLAS